MTGPTRIQSEAQTTMSKITAYDHIAITVADLDRSCEFYARLFGGRHVTENPDNTAWIPNDAPRDDVRRLAIGDVIISIHQVGNGIDLVAKAPTPGAADICFRWSGTIDSAVSLVASHGIPLRLQPDPRVSAEHKPAHSIYFEDPDGNLLELMADD